MKKLLLVVSFCLFYYLDIQVYAQGFADSSWPMFGRNPEHTNRGVNAPSATNELKWKFKVDGTIGSPSIGADGTLYAVSSDQYLYALNPDGSLKWKYFIGYLNSDITPAIGSNGTIYFGSEEIFYAINPDGTLKFKLNFEEGTAMSSPPVIGYDGTIILNTAHHYLTALSAEGDIKWRFPVFAEVRHFPTVSRDGTIYYGAGDSYFYAINPDGTLKWKYGDDFDNRTSSSIGDDGTIYVPIQRELFALNPDGTIKWHILLYNGIGNIVVSPAIDPDGTIYIGSQDFTLYAVNPDGTLKWEYMTGGPIDHAAAVGSDGCIYVASRDRDQNMYAFNPDGTLRWKFPIGEATDAVIGADGTLYFGSDIGFLCALIPEKKAEVKINNAPFWVDASHPNPFNPTTKITYTLDTTSLVTLSVFSNNGQKIADLVNSEMNAGAHSVTFNGSDFASGVYFYRFWCGGYTKTGKMLLMK